MVFGISKIHTNVDFTFSNNNHNDGKKVYLDKIPLYVYNYVHNHIDTKLQIQVTKIRRYGYGHFLMIRRPPRSTLI